MIKEIDYSIKDYKDVKYWLKFIEKNELATTDTNSHMNYFIHKNKIIFDKEVSKNMKMIHCDTTFRSCCDYWKCSQSRRLKEDYESIMCGFYEKDEFKEGFLNELIEKYILKRQILFIVFDFLDYGLDDDITTHNEYVPHVCLLIMIPNKEKYEAYYVNSHGKDLQMYDSFDFKLTKHKKRTIKYEHPVDLMFIGTFIKFMNKNHKVDIVYDYSEKHNYFGADYQSGDNYGICFIFPYLIWYYFGKYYNKTRYIYHKNNKYEVKSNREMLLNGNLTECMQGYLVELNKNYKEMYVKSMLSNNYNRKYYVNKLDKVLEKSKSYFVKRLLNVFMPFFCQGLD